MIMIFKNYIFLNNETLQVVTWVEFGMLFLQKKKLFV